MIGRTISHYKIVDKLGEGGMGSVWKAEDTTLNRLVAIKVLSSHLAENEEARERFIREAQATSSLNHSNITTVYELLEDDGEQYIVMEYVEGKTIRDLLETGHVSIRKAVDIVIQAAAAFEAAHRKGILHRDIKSANIMVSMEGNVKVMDFGLAHLEERSKLTRTGTTMGTLAYSSPEQLTGRPYDERSEIWSLGVVFYELLTGQLPFKSPSEGELVFTIINNEQDRPSQVRDDISLSVEAVAIRMLDKDPTLRYESMGEVISDLQAVRRELETSTVGIAATSIQSANVIRKRRIVRTMLMSAVLLTVGAVFFLTSRSTRLDETVVFATVFENRTQDPTLDHLGDLIGMGICLVINQTDYVSAVDFAYSYRIASLNRQSSDPGENIIRSRDQAIKMRAGIMVTGSYYLISGDSLQVQISLMSTKNNELIEALRPLIIKRGDETAIQNQVSSAVLMSFGRNLDPRVALLSESFGVTGSVAAQQAFLNGLDAFFMGNDWRSAVQLFNQSVESDPDFISPRIWKIRVLLPRLNRFNSRAVVDSLVEYIDQRRDHLTLSEKYMLDIAAARLRGDRGGEFYFNMQAADKIGGDYWLFQAGQIVLWQQNKPRKALKYFEKINQNEDLLVGWPGYIVQSTYALHALGQHEDAMRLARKYRLSGRQVQYGVQQEVQALAFLGRVEEIESLVRDYSTTYPPELIYSLCADIMYGRIEEDEFNQFVQAGIHWLTSMSMEGKNQNFITNNHARLAHLYLLAGQFDTSSDIYEQLLLDEDTQPDWHADYALLLIEQGENNRAKQEIEWLEENMPQNGQSLWILCQAAIAEHLGNRAEALDYLQRHRSSTAFPINILFFNNWFSGLKGDPAFEKLIKPEG